MANPLPGNLAPWLWAAGSLVLLGMLFLASAPARGQSCSPPPAGLVSWWPADGNANDIAGS
ncbi:MAG TPA: hypothetical protein VNT26_04690, partial [Candidatus Sulfotelmatobacter sp.]|nr:hypothetical protein [Candidatus Sulfotelmatobacter sp.]